LLLDHFLKSFIDVILATFYLSLKRRGQGHQGAEEDDIFLLKYSLYAHFTLNLYSVIMYYTVFHSNCRCECYLSQGNGNVSTCESHQLVVRKLVSAKDGRETLSVSTRTAYILSARTNPCYLTTHCSVVSTVLNAMSFSNYIADSYHICVPSVVEHASLTSFSY